jgi:hypothetical protein
MRQRFQAAGFDGKLLPEFFLLRQFSVLCEKMSSACNKLLLDVNSP